jgi:hypothetical protein
MQTGSHLATALNEDIYLGLFKDLGRYIGDGVYN